MFSAKSSSSAHSIPYACPAEVVNALASGWMARAPASNQPCVLFLAGHRAAHPELWSNIESGRVELQDRECLESWLQRSGKSPLSIHDEQCDLFNILDIIILPNLRLTTLLTLFRLPSGSLQSLDIVREASVIAFQVAHRPRRAELDGSRSGLNTGRVVTDLWCLSLPWVQLSVLALPGIEISADSCVAVLRVCVALELCSLHVSRIDDHGMHIICASGEQMVTLPALHTFYLKALQLYIPRVFPPCSIYLFCATSSWGPHIRGNGPSQASFLSSRQQHTLQSLYVGHAPYGIYAAPAPSQIAIESPEHALLECVVNVNFITMRANFLERIY
ncbi:hypothetical protein BD779DRAFT_1473526 [Infundibulicybe gibba]|nr:hypothetical protein BD779DRAFT_1473526 [Infundibulicybe gibba]